jgi:hypothetical protein
LVPPAAVQFGVFRVSVTSESAKLAAVDVCFVLGGVEKLNVGTGCPFDANTLVCNCAQSRLTAATSASATGTIRQHIEPKLNDTYTL